MAINWNGFESSLTSYFQAYAAQNFSQAAQFIAMQYDMSVRLGGEMISNNFVLTGNMPALQMAINLSFSRGYSTRSGVYNSLSDIANGLRMYWVGATLSMIYPPPGTVAVIANYVVSPGTAVGFPTPPSTRFDTWAKAFVMMARMHLMTLQGQIVALVPTPTGPIPIMVPWFGYR
jgi:hypothetical protein